jgi:hypothetical protein
MNRSIVLLLSFNTNTSALNFVRCILEYYCISHYFIQTLSNSMSSTVSGSLLLRVSGSRMESRPAARATVPNTMLG